MKEVQAYKCEYCGKLYKVRGTCIKHEKYCRLAPNNQHACLWCSNLQKIIPIDGPIQFYCPKVHKSFHTYVAERRNLKCVAITERMPLICELYENVSSLTGADFMEYLQNNYNK